MSLRLSEDLKRELKECPEHSEGSSRKRTEDLKGELKVINSYSSQGVHRYGERGSQRRIEGTASPSAVTSTATPRAKISKEN